MKIVCVSLCCILFFCFCQHTNVNIKNRTDSEDKLYTFVADSTDSSTRQLHEGRWYFNFKNDVLIRCLKNIYPQRFSAFIDSTDASTSANIEHLGNNQEVLKIVDSLANAFTKRPEASWTIENAKVTMNVCIDYRNSTELDSLAVFFYRKFN